ncbi:MAG: LysR family transcriptional regulator [Gemmatimonadetes bacterium]|nr:LysR family transcriptional regulator [Gemmatimonadota bacterium]
MARLNYRHLEYFWHVAREGGVTAASRVVHVGQPAISAQIRKLERALGEELFDRTGRTMVLTEVGRVVYGYADEIFSTGRDLTDAVDRLPGRAPPRLTVGVVDSIPKLMAHRLVMPALEKFEHLRLELTSGLPDGLFAALAVHDLDLVLSDSPLPTTVDVRAYNHFLGECQVVLMGAPELASQYRDGLPECLGNGPILMPGLHSNLRRHLLRWYRDRGLEPRVVAEIDDGAVLKVFGQRGLGMFAVPVAVETDVARQYDVERITVLEGVREEYYAISVERRIRNPAVAAITEAARKGLFFEDTDQLDAPDS